jgi:hypothetical protein
VREQASATVDRTCGLTWPRRPDLGRTGTLTLMLMMQRGDAYGPDGDPEVRYCWQAAGRASIRDLGVAYDLPYPIALDVVVSSLVIHHLDTDLRRHREVRRTSDDMGPIWSIFAPISRFTRRKPPLRRTGAGWTPGGRIL